MNFEADIASSLANVAQSFIHIPDRIMELPKNAPSIIEELQNARKMLQAHTMSTMTAIQLLLEGSPLDVAKKLAAVRVPPGSELSILSAVGAATISATFASVPDPTFDDVPYEGTSTGYDVNKAEGFFNKRPLFVAKRVLELAGLTNTFTLALLLDWRLGKWEENQPQRAKEALVCSPCFTLLSSSHASPLPPSPQGNPSNVSYLI